MTALISSKRVILIILTLLLQVACGTIPKMEDYTKSGMGRPVDGLKASMARPSSYASRIGWQEKTYDLPNGNWVLVEPEPRCMIHWEVNRQGIIVGYRTEG